MTEENKGQKNFRKGIANFVLISLLYIGLPIVFIILAHLLITNFQVSFGLIFGIIIIGVSNAASFFLRGYYPPKSMPNIIGGLALCIFSGLFFMYWLVIGSGIEISTDTYVAIANLGIISQIFVWTLIGTSVAFVMELFYYFKKLKSYKIVKITKYGFLIANLIAIGMLGVLIYQMAMTRYACTNPTISTQTIGMEKYYQVDTNILLSNSGFIPIKNIAIKILIYVEVSGYYDKGFYLGGNTTQTPNCNGRSNQFLLCNATSNLVNNSISISSVMIEIIFYAVCFGASMEILYTSIKSV